MKILQDTYLEQITDELDIINYQLKQLQERVLVNNESNDISLLESVNDINISVDAYKLYSESVSSSLKKIWNAIVRFIRNVFSSSGTTITTKEAIRVIESCKNAVNSAKADGRSFKKDIQIGFYLIAALGTSKDGASLQKAYENGETVKFVTSNISKIDVKKIPQNAKFRICIGSYPSSTNVSYNLTKETLMIINQSGLDGFSSLGSKMHESIEPMLEYSEKDMERAKTIHDHTVDEIIKINRKLLSNKLSDEESDKLHARLRELRKKDARSKNIMRNENKHDDMSARTEIEERQADKRDYAKFLYKHIRDNILDSIDIDKYDLSDTSQIEKLKKELSKCSSEKRKLIGVARQPGVESNPDDIKNIENKIDMAKKLIEEAESKKKNPNQEDSKSVKSPGKEKQTSKRDNMTKIGVAAISAVAIGTGIAYLIKKHKKKNPNQNGESDHLSMMTITYVNENSSDALAQIRMYKNSSAENIIIHGSDRVSAVRNDLVTLAEQMSSFQDDLIDDDIMIFAQNILTVFSGLVTKND